MLGRREAERRHLAVAGTAGLLKAAAKLGLVDLKGAFPRLRLTNFHISQALLDRLLEM